ncbi:hypothetical protein MMSR116_05895 [Methylobacterium mesophilicum SR1.6/6]|uniref:Uncharacterized protein n=1 Tax=Methylobacterium mesophilicum SR1.6/6 TaxID=908290 RepID=A0A6B9FK13_9HYPH|nr:hypothetical protein [Methylobacterium mesophilicum]QGY01485.1 hypothetical protein MMSR116_05895 [Methylobacterium mesophilicum SR1.6/6]
MGEDYFAQKKAAVAAEQAKANEASQARRSAAMKREAEAREHLRDDIIPFFKRKADAVAQSGSVLRIEMGPSPNGQLPASVKLILAASNARGARQGLGVVIDVIPSVRVVWEFPPNPGRNFSERKVMEYGHPSANGLTSENLERIYKLMVDQFFEGST